MIVAVVVLLFAVSSTFAQSCGRTPIEPDLSRGHGSPSDFIVGGTVCRPNSWPWQIVWCRKSGNTCSLSCGGSVVHNNWVITAGHCVSGNQNNPQNFAIKAGAHDHTCNNENCATQVNVQSISLHPQYNANTLTNDIALIRLATPLTYGTTIQPVCLPNADGAVTSSPNTCWTTGWGTTRVGGGGAVSQYLQQVRLPFVNHTVCNQNYNNQVNQNTMVCAGSAGIDACQGDSGGPLVVQASNGNWFMHGITSWGQGCANAGYPGVWARTSAFCAWIAQTTNNEVQCQNLP